MLEIVGWFMVAVVGLHMFVNSLYILVSPRVWFQLPNWIRTQGFWFEAKCASGGGAIQARLTGGLLLVLIVWVLYSSLLGRT